jgi:anti-anti-sigma regulatory factor
MINISRKGLKTAFTLIGRIDAKEVVELQTLFDSVEKGKAIVLNLNEVQLVDPDGIRFLAGCEENGAQLKNCPAYVREWIDKERSQK